MELTAENSKITDPAKLKQQLDLAEHIKKGECSLYLVCMGRQRAWVRSCGKEGANAPFYYTSAHHLCLTR